MTTRRVLFISKGEDSASTRYRAFNYFPYLQQAGWQTDHLTAAQGPVQRLRILRRAGRADVVVIVRKTLSPLFLHLLRKTARHLVFDFDDAIFLRSNGEPSTRRLSGFQRTMAACDAVWAGNHYLADAAAESRGRVSVLPTSVEPDRYRVEVDKPHDHLDMVWIGSRSTRKYLLEALPALETLAQHHTHLRLKIIADFDLDTRHLTTVPIAWKQATEATELAASHIGIAPMPDNPWTRGKCALKILQYMAAGLPVVASPAGVNRDVVLDGENGYFAVTTDDWFGRLDELIRDGAKRGLFGRRGRERVIEGYSEAGTAKKMLAELNRLVQA